MLSLEITIEHHCLEDVISQLFLLETLELKIYYRVKRIKVLHQQLRSLKICVYSRKVEIYIDTPKLRYFSYHGKPMLFGLFKVSGLLDASISLHDLHDTKTAQWFANVKELLRLFGHCKFLNLICHWPEDLCFPEQLRENCFSPLSNLKHLHVEFSRVEFVWHAKLVDNLLWLSPHLQTMAIASGHQQISLKFEHEKVQNEELSCYPEACWKYHLKKVILVSFCGNNDVKEDLLQYFRQSAKSLIIIQDGSTSSTLS